MASPAEILHRDEALKVLLEKCKVEPGVENFVELASGLLARGHAAEALLMAEQSLQLAPTHSESRVQRASALLAMGRPRVAYVELQRLLAFDPGNRRAKRLLGRVFVDAGIPGRAAELLAERARHAPTSSLPVAGENERPASLLIEAQAGSSDIPTAPPADGDASSDFPNLFAELTRDLGLDASGSATPPAVEVTQVIRRKDVPSLQRSVSELSEIQGPIVDNTQSQSSEEWIFEHSQDLHTQVGQASQNAKPSQELQSSVVESTFEAPDTIVERVEEVDDYEPLEPVLGQVAPSRLVPTQGPAPADAIQVGGFFPETETVDHSRSTDPESAKPASPIFQTAAPRNPPDTLKIRPSKTRSQGFLVALLILLVILAGVVGLWVFELLPDPASESPLRTGLKGGSP